MAYVYLKDISSNGQMMALSKNVCARNKAHLIDSQMLSKAFATILRLFQVIHLTLYHYRLIFQQILQYYHFASIRKINDDNIGVFAKRLIYNDTMLSELPGKNSELQITVYKLFPSPLLIYILVSDYSIPKYKSVMEKEITYKLN